ncbi:unnamed protein product [Trichobilharzia regenti]|nr:unnamed protein product [Trichobilharzia regenti]
MVTSSGIQDAHHVPFGTRQLDVPPFPKSLEDKMRWLKNFERLQEIQSQLIWPSVSELEPRVFIPEFLRQSLARQPCERLIANPKRQLLHEGFLTLNDGTKTIEIFAFLFDDFLLITRIKKPPKKVCTVTYIN